MDLQPQVPIGRVHTADEATLGIANAANKAYLLNQSRINESDISHTHTNNEAGMHDGPGRQDRGDLKRRSVSEKEFSGVEEADERDIRKRQDFHGKYLFWLAYQSIGVIYGDIGTSPLYVYSSTFSSDPSHEDLLGALSLIIWTLTLIVSVKYVLVVLRADDEGEGGTFAIYSLLSRYAHIVRRDPREEHGIKMERIRTRELKPSSKHTRNLLERSRMMHILLKIIGVFGVSLIMSDGVLTPAQSVLGAIQGLEVIDSGITKSTIVGTSCAILILLFLIQPLGITKIGSAFAPIVILWLVFNLSFGIYNLVHFDHTVLKAFSPYFAGAFFVRNKTDGWKSLGGILLSFTGVEALFADLGAFTRPAIQLSWLCFGYPCLLLAYIGQAAYISQNKDAFSNPFFNSVPPGMFYPSLVVAILAAIVASQTMITATFQLLSQIIKLSYFPQIKVKHTSKIFHGQIYIPWVNWLLMVGTICVTAAYSNTTKLGEAYGVCVILVTFLTTIMVCLVALIVWRLHFTIALAFFIIFGTLDALYLSSALTKVPDGAWFTLSLAILLSSIFVLWRYGKETQWRAEAEDRVRPSHLIAESPLPETMEDGSQASAIRLTPAYGGHFVSRLRGIGIFFDKTGSANGTPTVFIHFLQKFQATTSVVVFFHIRPLSTPTVDPVDRFSVTRCFPLAGTDMSLRQMYRVTVRHGYMDNVLTSDLDTTIYEHLRGFIIREGAEDPPPNNENAVPSMDNSASTSSSSTPPDPHLQQNLHHQRHQQSSIRKSLEALQSAYEDQVVRIVGKEQMRVLSPELRCVGNWTGRWIRRIALAAFLWIRSNTGSRVANMELEVEKLVEVGFVKVI